MKKRRNYTRLIIAFLVIVFLVVIIVIAKCLEDDYIPFINFGTTSKYETNNYDYSKLKKDSNGYYHYEDDNYTSLVGIDISEHNENIDFKKVKDAGIDFVYLRLGWRGYTEGLKHVDKKFEEYYKAAKEAGLKVGVYFYSQAKNRAESIEEARMVLDNIRDKEIDLPVCLDYETAPEDDHRLMNLTVKEYSENAKAFLDYIKEYGYTPILYTNLDWLSTKYDLDIISDYYIWFAQYNSLPQYPYKYQIWQYSEEGKVDGIDKPVDLNIMFVPKLAE